MSRKRDEVLPMNVPGVLIRRTIGPPPRLHMSDRVDYQLMRLLMKSRGSSSSPGDLDEGQSDPVKALDVPLPILPKDDNEYEDNDSNQVKTKWFRTKVNARAEFVGQLLMMKEPLCNSRSFYLPSAQLKANPFRKKFTIVDPSRTPHKWRSWDTWFIKQDDPYMENGVPGTRKLIPIPNALIVLEDFKIVVYSLETGQKTDELVLPSTIVRHFSHVKVDNTAEVMYVYSANGAVRRGCNQNVFMECLIIQYPPLIPKYRIVIPKTGSLGSVSEIAFFQGIALVCKSTSIELYNLEEIRCLNGADQTVMEYWGDNHNTPKVPKITFNHKPSPLVIIPKACSNFLMEITGSWPPHVFVKAKDAFEIRGLNTPETSVYHIDHNIAWDSVFLSDIHGNSPRIMIGNLPHGFDIIELKRSSEDPNSYTTDTVFSTVNFQIERKIEPVSNEDSRNSGRPARLRQMARRNYAKDDLPTVFGHSYDEDIGLFVLCDVTFEVLYIRILDIKTFKVFKMLKPVKLTCPKGMKSMQCSSVAVQFHEWYLSVLVGLNDENSKNSSPFYELYTANLLGELTREEYDRAVTLPLKKTKKMRNSR